jgi:hypothetical protein
MLLGILLTGEFWVRFWAAAILDFFTNLVPARMAVAMMPIIRITIDISIREKACFFVLGWILLFIDEIGFLRKSEESKN